MSDKYDNLARAEYEADVRRRPTFGNGTPRKTWDQLSAGEKLSWYPVQEEKKDIFEVQRELDLTRIHRDMLEAALRKLLASDAVIALVTDAELQRAIDDVDAGPDVREQAAAVLGARSALAVKVGEEVQG